MLDLFAGTGAMGLEALSRGARFCVFVDRDAEALRIIGANIRLCLVQERSRIIQGPVTSVIRRLCSENELFDLIFMDPPYGKGYIEEAIEIVGEVSSDNARVIAERHVKDEQPAFPGVWQKDLERKYGDTLISVYSRL